MRTLKLILLMICGAALSLAFPRVSLLPIVWVGLIPLLIAIKRATWKSALLPGFLFGFGYFAALLYWIAIFGYLPWILLSIMQALFIALFSGLAAIIYKSRRSWIELTAIPALWTIGEWARSLGMFGFTWGDLAYSQTPNLPFVQLSSVTGPWGLTFIIVLANVALASDKRKRLKPIGVAVLLVAALHIWGGVVIHNSQQDDANHIVALAQGSIDQNITLTSEQRIEIIRVYTELTRKAADVKPDFIVWPETVVPGDIIKTDYIREWISDLAKESNAYLLVGAPYDQPASENKPATEKNGAYMFTPDGKLSGSYYKVHLVPFGETVPGRKWLPFLERYRVREVDVSPGEEHNLLETEFGDVAALICFESIFPYIARQQTLDGAGLIFVITNDGWFLKTFAAAQHHDFSVFRAVENRRYVLHNGTTGVSSCIDPQGRVLDKLDIWKRGVLYGDVAFRSDKTVFTRFGNWFVALCFIFTAIGMIAGITGKHRKRRHPRRKPR